LNQSAIEEVVASYADVLSGAAIADPDADADSSDSDAADAQEKAESAD
jgi:hypothetical protein